MQRYIRILRALAVVVAALACLKAVAGGEESESVTLAQADFYEWEAADGSISFTDDPAVVPPARRKLAKARSWGDLKSSRARRESLADPAKPPYIGVALPKRANPNRQRDCTHPVFVDRRRVQEGDYNRTRYFVIDECGLEAAISPDSPDLDTVR